MKIHLSLIALLLASSSVIGFAANTQTLDADTQKKVVGKVKEYCALMQEFSGDVEKVDNMEKIYAMCDNSNVSNFNDLAVASKKDISLNSMPLQQYMMMITEKFENKVKTSYSGFKYIKTEVQPSPLKEFDATTFAFVKVDKQVNAPNYKAKQHLNILVNTATMKISSTISEDYEDPQKVYMEALSLFNEKNYKKAIPLFEQVSNLSKFSGRYRAKSMLGWIYVEQKDFQKGYDLLKESSVNDPLGSIILATKILQRDDVPINLRNVTEAGNILLKLSETRDKDYPYLHLIAKSAIVDAIDIQTMNIKFDLSKKVSDNIAEELINDPATTDAFRMRGYFLKAFDLCLTKNPKDVEEALTCINKADEMLAKANLERKDFEHWDTQISEVKILIYQKLGDQDSLIALVKSFMTERPWAAGVMGIAFVVNKDFKNAMEYYRKAAEYGDPQACYYVALSHLPTHEPLLVYENFMTGWLYKTIPGKFNFVGKGENQKKIRNMFDAMFDFTYFLLTDKSQTRSTEEYLKWLQKSIDLGNVDAMEDMAFLKIVGEMPGVERNIPEGLRLLCTAEQMKIRDSKSLHAFIINSFSYNVESEEKIPFLQSKTYETLKSLADQGNGPAAYFLSCDYLSYVNDTIKAQEYLKQACDAKYFYAMYDYAHEVYDRKEIDKAFELFKELTIFRFSYAYGAMGDIERLYRKNYEQARKYYRQGIRENEPGSYEGLSDLYKDGLGVTRNLKAAKDYIGLAISCYKLDFELSEEKPSDRLKELMAKRDEIDKLIAAGGDTNITSGAIEKLNSILDSASSEEKRITLSQTLLKEVFASPKAVVKTLGSNGKTVVSTETAEDFMLRLATMKTGKKLVVSSSKVDKNNKFTELTVQMK